MKMPRSQNEADNVKFVQELAEVDGPFESPININFRDLAKLELPSLVWNRGDTCPKKMKITNTGHTVIISGKWKCERPYLTGGPLAGKYVFSQIHFHWGQDDCKGSEHQVCGDGFPLEMHVAHFKTEYLTQECALREKDGMVVVVYLFKLQEEPNQSLKKIISLLPCVQQPSTSHAVDPRPILSFCNPFTDDYFMYWGSVVTSTCAHILLWIICREPFGISKEQVNEFRKIMDSSQQPICRNSREVQPLHKRNVFHVNASKHLDDPLLPVKKLIGCYCKESREIIPTTQHPRQQQRPQSQEHWKGREQQPFEHHPPQPHEHQHPQSHEHLHPQSYEHHHQQSHEHHHQQSHEHVHLQTHEHQHVQPHEHQHPQAESQDHKECLCQILQNQEEIEGSIVEYESENYCAHNGGARHMHLEGSLQSSCFQQNQTIFVHRATVQSVPGLKRFGSEPVGNHRRPENSRHRISNHKRESKYTSKLVSKSCCFLTVNECGTIKVEKRKNRGKKPFNSIRAFSQIMHSLEALKNQTFKKLKEIESINQEIKGMKSVCQDNADKRWLRKIEKLMNRQKRFTIKSSQGCLSELRKLAKDCNLDKIFDYKALPANENGKLTWIYNGEITKENFSKRESVSTADTCVKRQEQEIPEKDTTKEITIGKAMKFSAKAQKLIQSFFEDIQDTDELHETVKKDLNLKKMKSYCTKQAGDSHSVSSVIKGYITQNMFLSGNLGNRFFTEVSTEDIENYERQHSNTKPVLIVAEEIGDETKGEKKERDSEYENSYSKNVIPKSPSQKKNVAIIVSESSAEAENAETPIYEDPMDDFRLQEKPISSVDTEPPVRDKKTQKMKKCLRISSKISPGRNKNSYYTTPDKSMRQTEATTWYKNTVFGKDARRSSSTLSTESTEIRKMVAAKCRRRRSTRYSCEPNSSYSSQIVNQSYSSIYEQNNRKELENYYLQKKNHKTKKRKKGDSIKPSESSSRWKALRVTVSKWRNLKKAKFRVEMKKTSESLMNAALENSVVSPRRKRIKLQSQKGSARPTRDTNDMCSTDEVDREIVVMPTVESRLQEKGYEVSTPEENSSKNQQHRNSPKNRNEWKDGSWSSVTKTIRASSVDSKTTFREEKVQNKESYVVFPKDDVKVLDMKFPERIEKKPKVKSRSFTGLPTSPRITTEIAQRLCLESIDDRRKNNKEVSDLINHLEFPKNSEERSQNRDLSRGTSTYNSEFSKELEQKPETNDVAENTEEQFPEREYNVEFFTTTPNRLGLVPNSEVQEVKTRNAVLKRCDAEKYQFLKKISQETNQSFTSRKEDCGETVQQTDSNRSFTKDASKGDADPKSINKDLQTSVSYLQMTKSSPSRPHSAETLNSLTKTLKRKGKKRPHCCKRISRHYIRKNSSIFKKPQKTDSKHLNFLSLTDQEQLKIISVNVVKYIKEKLIEENKGLDPNKTSLDNIEEAVLTKLKAAQEKKEEKPQKEPPVNKEEKKKQNRIPALKARGEKKKEKPTGSENVIKEKEEKPESPPKCEKPNSAVPKPVNNFIKLNKQMAGKYKKKVMPQPEKKDEPKKKAKSSSPDTGTKSEIPKFRTRIPKKQTSNTRIPKTVDKNPVQKGKEPTKTRPETPSSPKIQKPTSRGSKESRIKSPVANTQSKNKKPKKEAPPANNTVQTKELVTVQTPKESPLTIVISEKSLSDKNQLLPTHAVTSYSPTEIIDGQQSKISKYLIGMSSTDYLPEVMHDSNGKMLTEGREAVFKKELEYFIKLEMLDISANLENSLKYVNSTPSQDHFRSNYVEDVPPAGLNSYDKEIVLLKMQDGECASSTSDFMEDIEKFALETEDKREDWDIGKEIVTVKIPKESDDPGITQTLGREHHEETNSDSSYDCKISITLNTNFNVEGQLPQNESAEDKVEPTEECRTDLLSTEISDRQQGPSNGQPLKSLDKSSSQSLVVKQHPRKRKENEISLEMKHKLLEILEGEIRREVGMKCRLSSENESDGLTFMWEDSDGNNRSQSTVSSCDNLEVLTQISDTMRQYLRSLKEKGQLVEIINVSSDKESK